MKMLNLTKMGKNHRVGATPWAEKEKQKEKREPEEKPEEKKQNAVEISPKRYSHALSTILTRARTPLVPPFS